LGGVIPLLLALGCRGSAAIDLDGDGVPARKDCDDTDPTIYPGAADEWYDGIDADCAGNDDFDADADGVASEMDCDDADPTRAPGLAETWYDGVDSDCSGDSDWDADGDGFTAPGSSEGDPTDCDDSDPQISPAIVRNADRAVLGVPGSYPAPGELWAVGTMLRVSNLAIVAQHHATVAAGADGRFAAAWQWGKTYDRPFPLVRLLEDDLVLGTPLSAAPLDVGGIKPDIEAFAAGYVVAFEETQTDIWLSGFDLDGAQVRGPLRITASDGIVEAPDIALYPGGGGYVAYTAVGGGAGVGTHRIQPFDTDLSAVGPPIDLEEGGRTIVEVSELPDGGWVAVATKQMPMQGHFQVYGRLVHADGCISNFRADQGESDAPSRPAIAVAEDGSFAVTWRAKVAVGEGEGVYGRFFDDRAGARSDSFLLSGDQGDANRPVVAIWGDLAMFAWEGEADGEPLPAPLDVSTQTWSVSRMEPITAPQRLNQLATTISAERPAVSIAPRGDGTATALVTWEQVGPDTRVTAIPVILAP
jgi:hypothetical protein